MFGVIATGYLAIGCVVHTILIGTAFNPANVFAWGCILAWPAVLFILGLLLFFACFGLIVLGCWLSDAAHKVALRLYR